MSTLRARAESKLLQENERVIITEWRLKPDAETGWHRHAHDYVVVCQRTLAPLVSSTISSTRTPMSSCSLGSSSNDRATPHKGINRR